MQVTEHRKKATYTALTPTAPRHQSKKTNKDLNWQQAVFKRQLEMDVLPILETVLDYLILQQLAALPISRFISTCAPDTGLYRPALLFDRFILMYLMPQYHPPTMARTKSCCAEPPNEERTLPSASLPVARLGLVPKTQQL